MFLPLLLSLVGPAPHARIQETHMDREMCTDSGHLMQQEEKEYLNLTEENRGNASEEVQCNMPDESRNDIMVISSA